jgi:hypothetical protein
MLPVRDQQTALEEFQSLPPIAPGELIGFGKDTASRPGIHSTVCSKISAGSANGSGRTCAPMPCYFVPGT